MTPEPVEGQPCPVCGYPDPDHDWDVHDREPGPMAVRPAGQLAAALPDMLLRSSTRGGQRVRVLALHTTEGILRSRDLRAWAAWTGSSHASADAAGTLLGPDDGFVPYHLAAWTLRSGNPWSENIELCGFASWTRQDWLDRPLLLEAAARWLADRHRATGVPLVKLTAAQYRAGASGVIDHNDHTVGYQDGTHWDVGQAFPWDVVLPRAVAIATPPAPPEDDTMPQLLSHYVPPGEDHTLPIPPPESGAAGWGPGFASVAVDRFGKGAAPVAIRAAVMNAAGQYRPLFGKSMDAQVAPGSRPVVKLQPGDQVIVLSALDETVGVGLLVEYGPR